MTDRSPQPSVLSFSYSHAPFFFFLIQNSQLATWETETSQAKPLTGCSLSVCPAINEVLISPRGQNADLTDPILNRGHFIFKKQHHCLQMFLPKGRVYLRYRVHPIKLQNPQTNTQTTIYSKLRWQLRQFKLLAEGHRTAAFQREQ